MKIDGKNVLFDRKVYVTISKFSLSEVLKKKEVLDNKSLTLCYDTQSSILYRNRIDFIISMNGDQDLKKAKIDLYNLGPEIRQFLNAYNQQENNSMLLLKNEAHWSIIVQVGYDGMALETIFSGFIHSFNMERRQTSSDVDEIWHLYCSNLPQVDKALVYIKDMKAVSGENYGGDKEFNIKRYGSVYTYEQYLLEIIANNFVMLHPEPISTTPDFNTWANTPMLATTGVKATNTSALLKELNGGQPNQSTMSVIPTQQNNMTRIKYINADRETILKNFKIFYAYPGSVKEDEELKKKWKTKGVKQVEVKADDLLGALKVYAKRIDACECSMLQKPNGFTYVYIWKAGVGGKKRYLLPTAKVWKIHNFQNVISNPDINDGALQISIILEPGIKAQDGLKLEIDDKIPSEHVSFNMNYGDSAYFINQFSNVNVGGGAMGSTNTYNKASAQKYGNIFFKKYLIVEVVHQGSTHEATWQTTMRCVGGDE